MDPQHSAALPQTRIGILGGGQLGRMLALAGANMGVHVTCLDGTSEPPAAIASRVVKGNVRVAEDVEAFAQTVDVLSVETEHVDVAALDAIAAHGRVDVQPRPSTLRLIQDKFAQKEHFKAKGIALGEYSSVVDSVSLRECAHRFGYPLMLKSRRLAYDGRGNCVVRSELELESGVAKLGGYITGIYAEKWQPFTKELAVMVVRSRTGEVRTYPVTHTVQKNSQCHVTEMPAAITTRQREQAEHMAVSAVAALEGAGVFGVEVFLLPDGQVLLNEVAPRVHNSGHVTMNACATSQFENHLRALLGWPLGDTSMTAGAGIMLNIIGEADGADGDAAAQTLVLSALRTPGCSVHWYEKKALKARKLGHVNIVGRTRYEARERLRELDADALASLSGKPAGAAEGRLPLVGIIMGSDSDLPTMAQAAAVLEDEFDVAVEVTIVSAHRTPDRLVEYARSAHDRGLQVIIAGAGGAAHLPGMVAAMTPLPVVGVPVKPAGCSLDGMDALLSIVQMPKGVPVATVAIGNAANAGLLAVRILASTDGALRAKMLAYQEAMRDTVANKARALETKGWKDYLKA